MKNPVGKGTTAENRKLKHQNLMKNKGKVKQKPKQFLIPERADPEAASDTSHETPSAPRPPSLPSSPLAPKWLPPVGILPKTPSTQRASFSYFPYSCQWIPPHNLTPPQFPPLGVVVGDGLRWSTG